MFFKGCKVESISLNVDAVNTHRDRPEVSTNIYTTHKHCTLSVSNLLFRLLSLGGEERPEYFDQEKQRDPIYQP